MNMGFRYHVASLLAVFFSLILGILIGGALFPDHALVEEQALLIAELEERFRETNAKLGALQAELDFSVQAWSQLRDSIARDCLSDRAVVLVGAGGSPLEAFLEQAGAQLEHIDWDGLAQIAPEKGLTIVFPLGTERLSSEQLGLVQNLAAVGANLSFVWETGLEPVLMELPPSLQVDSIDTSVGEIAFLLGLASNAQGHYGLHKDAQGLFP